ncbi:MAG: hypothetical protein ACI9EW_003549 [Cellvibrionaceae bacterium]|jgi:hypothetical protein
MQLDTVIFNCDGRFFRFKQQGQQYICDVCYWRGELSLLEDGTWIAEIKQKYDPFEHYQSDPPLESQNAGMHWITSRLIKAEQ